MKGHIYKVAQAIVVGLAADAVSTILQWIATEGDLLKPVLLTQGAVFFGFYLPALYTLYEDARQSAHPPAQRQPERTNGKFSLSAVLSLSLAWLGCIGISVYDALQDRLNYKGAITFVMFASIVTAATFVQEATEFTPRTRKLIIIYLVCLFVLFVYSAWLVSGMKLELRESILLDSVVILGIVMVAFLEMKRYATRFAGMDAA